MRLLFRFHVRAARQGCLLEVETFVEQIVGREEQKRAEYQRHGAKRKRRVILLEKGPLCPGEYHPAAGKLRVVDIAA